MAKFTNGIALFALVAYYLLRDLAEQWKETRRHG